MKNRHKDERYFRRQMFVGYCWDFLEAALILVGIAVLTLLMYLM